MPSAHWGPARGRSLPRRLSDPAAGGGRCARLCARLAGDRGHGSPARYRISQAGRTCFASLADRWRPIGRNQPGTDGRALYRLHPRTLNRRLQAEGTSLRTLLDESRYRIARQLLRDTLFSVEDLAVALGYADATAFSRAFRRWSGTSASRWRATQPGVERTDAAGGGRDPIRPAHDLEAGV
ncbi:MAG: helix-turn-helix transcriptional regulator [Chromatiaceae bacterium]